jgi:hypothetical protein
MLITSAILYTSINSIISAWTIRHSLNLFTQIADTGGLEVRGAYFSNTAGECCQIWITSPQNGIIKIHAADVETKSESWHKEWSSLVDSLAETLDEALEFTNRWLQRDGSKLHRI